MIYFEVKDYNGKILAGNMQEFSKRNEFENNKTFSKNKDGRGLKGACEKIDNLSVWIVVENDSDLLKSAKLFKKTFGVYKKVASDVYIQYKKEINAYAHILNTIQAQIRQKIDNFADSQKFYGEIYSDSIKNISDIIAGDKEAAADLICYTRKRTIDMHAHLLGAEVIHSGEQYEVKPVKVSLRKAILNQCTPFLDEFETNRVKLRFFFEDECEVEIDKNMFSLIMYNFFSNAVKYIKFDSELRLHYSDKEKSLDVSMESLKMDKNELVNLHKEGVRGNHAKNIPGKGIGLFVISKALELMKKDSMLISPNYKKTSIYNDIPYVENHFKFLL